MIYAGLNHTESETSTHVVSYWCAPGDYTVINATRHNAFVDSEEDAQQIADKLGDCPPAMAIAQYREGKRSRRARNAISLSNARSI